mgnify:CR=1 FL=1
MLNEKGQSFDAFKLLIAAVVAAAILVIIIGIINQVDTPLRDPLEVMNLGVTSLTAPDVGNYYKNVEFKEGSFISANGVASEAGKNPGTVCFCDSANPPACPDDSIFTGPVFTVTGNCGNDDHSLKANQEIGGSIWVFRNATGHYKIGFRRA